MYKNLLNLHHMNCPQPPQLHSWTNHLIRARRQHICMNKPILDNFPWKIFGHMEKRIFQSHDHRCLVKLLPPIKAWNKHSLWRHGVTTAEYMEDDIKKKNHTKHLFHDRGTVISFSISSSLWATDWTGLMKAFNITLKATSSTLEQTFHSYVYCTEPRDCIKRRETLHLKKNKT